MKIPYIYLNFNPDAPDKDYWDMALISDILKNKTWSPALGYKFMRAAPLDEDGLSTKGSILIIAGASNKDYLEKIQEYIDRLKWCLLIVTSDEERQFDYTKLKHPNMKIWLQYPKLEDEADYYLPIGYPPQAPGLIEKNKELYDTKPLDWFFSGQNNHPRRNSAVEVLNKMLSRDDVKGKLNATQGFTQGMEHKEYYEFMTKSKSAPSPSGIQSPDSFRTYEALESGTVPIVDDLSIVHVKESGFWKKLMNGHGIPFKIYDSTEHLEGFIMDVVREYPTFNNRVFSWWQQLKRDIVYKLQEDVYQLSGWSYISGNELDKITVLIVSSPIVSHPSTDIIDQTIREVRSRLPESEIIIGIDGVRTEQEHYRERYELYKKELLWKCNYEWHNVLPIIFEEHLHQAAMTKKLLQLVKTPTILFVEHDCPITGDYEFDWEHMVEAIETGQANVIRFLHEALILEPYQHLMISDKEDVCGLPMIKTIQWSQRPHLASTVFYRNMIDRYFTEESRIMIEDVVHGRLQSAYIDGGMLGWYDWRVWIYAPEGNMKRSYTTDGRGNDPKFDDRFIK